MTSPFGVTVFCDDIRQEVSGKLTLVGCYGAEMLIAPQKSGITVTLPTLCALVELRIPVGFVFSKFKIVVIRESGEKKEVLAEVEAEWSGSDEIESSGLPNDKIISVRAPFQFAGVPIEGECIFRARAYFDDDLEVRLGALQARFVSDAPPESMTN